MRVIIAGSREGVTEKHVLYAVLLSGFEISSVVSGRAKGADTYGELFAATVGLPCVDMEADWDAHGRAAGHIRNRQMAKNADALIAVWDGQSDGTRNMIATARELGLKVFVFRTDRWRVDGPRFRRGRVK